MRSMEEDFRQVSRELGIPYSDLLSMTIGDVNAAIHDECCRRAVAAGQRQMGGKPTTLTSAVLKQIRDYVMSHDRAAFQQHPNRYANSLRFYGVPHTQVKIKPLRSAADIRKGITK